MTALGWIFCEGHRLLRLIDGGGDGAAQHGVGLLSAEDELQRVVGDMVGHRVDEPDVEKASGLERAADVGNPSRWSVAGDLCTARVVVGVYEEDAHAANSEA